MESAAEQALIIAASDNALVEHVRSFHDQEDPEVGLSKFEAEFVDYQDTEDEVAVGDNGDNFDSGMMADEDATEDVTSASLQGVEGNRPQEEHDLTAERSLGGRKAQKRRGQQLSPRSAKRSRNGAASDEMAPGSLVTQNIKSKQVSKLEQGARGYSKAHMHDFPPLPTLEGSSDGIADTTPPQFVTRESHQDTPVSVGVSSQPEMEAAHEKNAFWKQQQLPPCTLCADKNKPCKPIVVDAFNNTRICKRCWRSRRFCLFDQPSPNKTGRRQHVSSCDTCRRGGAKSHCEPILLLFALGTSKPLVCEWCWFHGHAGSCHLTASAVAQFVSEVLQSRTELVLVLERAGVWDALLEQGKAMHLKERVEVVRHLVAERATTSGQNGVQEDA